MRPKFKIEVTKVGPFKLFYFGNPKFTADIDFNYKKDPNYGRIKIDNIVPADPTVNTESEDFKKLLKEGEEYFRKLILNVGFG